MKFPSLAVLDTAKPRVKMQRKGHSGSWKREVMEKKIFKARDFSHEGGTVSRVIIHKDKKILGMKMEDKSCSIFPNQCEHLVYLDCNLSFV
jgi:hypothetical protein